MPDPKNAFSFAAIEFGLLGHILSAQSLFELTANPVKRQESQVELARLLAQTNNIEIASHIAAGIAYSSYRAEALAQIARSLAVQDISQAKALVEQAWNLLNPYQLPRERWRISRHTDEVLVVLAGTVARWSPEEADQIVVNWIREPEHCLRAQGEIVAAIAITHPQGAYARLMEMLDQAVVEGLSDFWLTIEVCTEALTQLLPEDQVVELYQHISATER